MYTIAFALKKHKTLRIFLTVALSLAMAWAVGSGIHLNNSVAENSPATVAAPVNPAANDNNARLNPAANNSPNSGDKVTALDAAIKNMSSIQRDRDSANTNTNTNNTDAKGGFAQTVNSPQNGANVGSNK